MNNHVFSAMKITAMSSATALLMATSAFAQDHSGHAMPQMDPSQMDHSNMPQGSHADVMAARAQHMVEARGTVRRVNAARREITLQHAAIPQVSWPAADMIFPVGPSIDLSRLSPGQPVQFTLHRAPNGSLPLVELCPAQGVHVTPGLCADGMNHGAMDHSKMNHSAHGTHD